MQAEVIRALLLSFPEVTEETPFGPEHAVYKTAGKMFALTNWDEKPLSFNLKCNPQKAEELRDQYDCVTPGYHMNKKHWNTVVVSGDLNGELLTDWITHSFECVVKGMPKKRRDELLERWRSHASDCESVDLEANQLRDSMRKGI